MPLNVIRGFLCGVMDPRCLDLRTLEQGAPRGLHGQHDRFIHLEDSQRKCGGYIPLCFKAQWNDMLVGTSGCHELSNQLERESS